MFTGIVREVGVVVARVGGETGVRLDVEAPLVSREAVAGASVALDGVCLTVESVRGDRLTFAAVPETLRRTTLGELAPGSRVNLEPAVRAGEPLDGHLVQGHVDGTGSVRSAEREGEGLRVGVEVDPALLRYCVEKGSIAIAGVSLTVAELHEGHVVVALVPHTLRATTLAELEPGRRVNLEVDVLAKYVERGLAAYAERLRLQP